MDFKLFIPFLAFLYIFIIAYKRKNKISMTIVGLYLLSSICSFFMDDEVLPSHNFSNDKVYLFLLYTILLSTFLFLTLKIKPFKSINELPQGPIIDKIFLLFSIGSFFSFIYLLPYTIDSFAISALTIRNSISETSVLPPTLLTTIAVGFPTFYFIYAFLFYLSIIQKRAFIVKLLMVVGVLNIVLNVLTVAGRDGFLFMTFAILIGFYLFEPLLSEKFIKTSKKIFYFFLIIGAIGILKITADRFSETGEINLLAFKVGIISYLGMQPYIFNDFLNYNEIFNYGYDNFNFIYNAIGFNTTERFEYTEPYTWMFGSFLVSFYAMTGYSSLILVSSMFWIYFKMKLSNLNKLYPIGLYFFYSFFFHFIISGIFYFRLGNQGGNIFMLLSVFIVFLFTKRK